MRQVVSSREGWSAGLISVNLWRSWPAPMRTADQGCRPTPRRSVRQRHGGRRRCRRRRGLSRRSNPDVRRRQWPPAARPPLRTADEIIRTIVIAAGWPTSSRPRPCHSFATDLIRTPAPTSSLSPSCSATPRWTPPGYLAESFGWAFSVWRSRQDLDVPVGSVHADPLPVPDQPGGLLHADDGRQAVFPGDHCAVGHQAAHLRHQARDRDEQG